MHQNTTLKPLFKYAQTHNSTLPSNHNYKHTSRSTTQQIKQSGHKSAPYKLAQTISQTS